MTETTDCLGNEPEDAPMIHTCTCGEEAHWIADEGLMCSACRRVTPFDELDDILPGPTVS